MGGNIRILNLLKTSAIDVQSARVWYGFLSYFAIGLWAQKVRSVSGPVRLFMSNEIPTQNENSQNVETGAEGKGFCKDSNFSNFFPQKGALVICLECTRGFESFWSMSKRGQILVSTGEKRGLYLLFIIIQVHGKLGVLRWSPNVGFVGKILYSGWTTLAQRRCQNRMSLIHCAYWGTNGVVSWKALWPRCP